MVQAGTPNSPSVTHQLQTQGKEPKQTINQQAADKPSDQQTPQAKEEEKKQAKKPKTPKVGISTLVQYYGG